MIDIDLKRLTPEARVIHTMFYIGDKQGKRVKFQLNESQYAYDLVRTNRDLIPKARQKGFSSYGIGLQCVDCLGKEGTRAVLISHEASSTQRLLDKARYYLQYIEGPKPELGRHSRNEFYFPKTESTLYIGTAGARAFGRGDTINHLHISEYAWWESDALEKVAGLFQAVPMNGTIRIESTGNGMGNDFYYMCTHAKELGYNLFFRSWHEDLEYVIEPPDKWIPIGFEDYFEKMQSMYNLTEPQLYWYWTKLQEFRLDLKYMQQEYPSCLQECFKASGGAVFPDITGSKTYHWKWKMDGSYRVEYHEQHPMENHTYVIGGDAAGGTGNDEAAITILCLETLEQVFEFGSNAIDPVAFGHLLARLGTLYNQAFLIPEGNNHGISTCAVLAKEYDRFKIYKRVLPSKLGKAVYGFYTGENSKKELIGSIHEAIENGLTLYGEKTIREMREFEEVKNKMEGPEDGLVISLGLACIGYFKYKRHIYQEPTKPITIDLNQNYMYFTYDEVFKDFPKPYKSTNPKYEGLNPLRRIKQ